MTGAALTGYIAITAAGFVLSAIFSGMETGLYTINRVRLTVRAASGDTGAGQIRTGLQHAARTLSILLIGTNASNYLGSYGLAEILHHMGLGDWSLIVLEAAVFTPLVFVFAETLPKELFRTHTDRWTYWFWPAIAVTRWLFTIVPLLPSVQLVTWVISGMVGTRNEGMMTARQRVSELLKEGVGAGVLSESQTTLADRALAMRDRRVGDVMVRWKDAVWVSVEAERGSREAVLGRGSFSRLPVVDKDGGVVGILTWSDAVLNPTAETRELAGEAMTLTAERRLLDALSLMRHRRQTMAIVMGGEGDQPVGLVTLKDLVEPLTGKLAAW